jgi:hypothetical protein
LKPPCLYIKEFVDVSFFNARGLSYVRCVGALPSTEHAADGQHQDLRLLAAASFESRAELLGLETEGDDDEDDE